MYSDLTECCVDVGASLMDALRVIDRAGTGIALVVKDEDLLFGVLTDGDIRRAIISGADLRAKLLPYIKKDFLSVSASEGRAEVLDLMQAHLIDQIPVIDENRKLLGLHLIHGILGAQQRSNWAVIMAGGKGSRLYPLTKEIPKPMVKVAGRPILERLILHLVSHGIKRVFLSVNYMSDVIKQHFEKGDRFGCQIEYLHEVEPLGTAGSLSLLPGVPVEPVLVMNGDLVTTANLGAMITHHVQGGYYATIGVKSYSHQVPYGCVTAKNGCVENIEEKPDIVRQVNAGIYVLSPVAIKSVPESFYPITDLFKAALSEEKKIGAFDIDGDWIDVGQHDQLREARGL